MQSRGALVLTAGLAATVFFAAAGVACAAEAPDAAARETALGRVCVVTAENALGVPLAYASGFLLGEGRFVITDLASLAQPDVKQVRLRFRDSSKAGATVLALAKQFAMADPSTGLVAVKVEQLPAGLSGLALSAASTVEEFGEVTVVGHKWGQDPDKPDIMIGQMSQVTPSAGLAEKLKVDPPKQAISLFNFAVINPEHASGSPVMASDRQLKPLAELPKPVWPVLVLPVAGKPVMAADFAQTVRAIKTRSRCGKCGGKGTLMVRTPIRTTGVGGFSRTTYKEESKTCDGCQGEGVLFPDGLYGQYIRMAEAGTWLALAGGVEPKVRDAAFSGGLDVLRAIAKVGKGYREDLVKEIKSDLSKGAAAEPHGMVVYAQVRELVDGPDGAYVLLSPHGAGATFAAKADRMAAVAEVRGTRLGEGHWIILAGLAMGPVSLGSQRATYVLPFAWADGPSFGPHPHKDGGQGGPASPPPPKSPGSPSFFGL
jgi:hypothetical protein